MPHEFLLLSSTKMGVDAREGLMNFYSPVFGTRVSFNDREVIQKGKKEKIGNCVKLHSFLLPLRLLLILWMRSKGEKYVSHRVGRKVKRDSLDNQLQMDPLVKFTSGTILWKNFRRRGRKNGAMSLSGDKIVHPREGELG